MGSMRKFQYCTQYISRQPQDRERSMQFINKMGEEGWEMMHCREVAHRLLEAVFKREVPQNVAK